MIDAANILEQQPITPQAEKPKGSSRTNTLGHLIDLHRNVAPDAKPTVLGAIERVQAGITNSVPKEKKGMARKILQMIDAVRHR